MNYIIYQVGDYWQSPSTYRAWQQPVDKSRIASTWFGNWLSNPSNVFGSINQTNLSPFSASTVGTLVCAFIVCYLTWYDSLLHELPDSISHSLKQVRGGKLHSGHTNESPVTMKKQSLKRLWSLAELADERSSLVRSYCSAGLQAWSSWTEIGWHRRPECLLLGYRGKSCHWLIKSSCNGNWVVQDLQKVPASAWVPSKKQGQHREGFISSETFLVWDSK